MFSGILLSMFLISATSLGQADLHEVYIITITKTFPFMSFNSKSLPSWFVHFEGRL